MAEVEAEPLLEDQVEDQEKVQSSHLTAAMTIKWGVYCLAILLLGITQYIPVPILIPTSVEIGLSVTQASLVLAAYPASSVVSMLLQPSASQVKSTRLFFLLVGSLLSLLYALFYFISQSKAVFLYCGILLRLIGGTLHFLIITKVTELITALFPHNVSRVSVSYDLFISIGGAIGPYLGTVLYMKLGFSTTMMVVALISQLTMLLLILSSPRSQEEASGEKNVGSILSLYIEPSTLVYCWLVMLCVGGCMVPVEGMTTLFYQTKYEKNVQYGGVVLGVCGIAYSISSLVFGCLSDLCSGLQTGLLLGGLGVMASSLLLMGPVTGSYLQLSLLGYVLLQVGSAAVQINSVTIATQCLSQHISAPTAVAVVVNAINVAYNIGAFIGPVVTGVLLNYIQFNMVFAIGSPFFVVTGLVVLCKTFSSDYQQLAQ